MALTGWQLSPAARAVRHGRAWGAYNYALQVPCTTQVPKLHSTVRRALTGGHHEIACSSVP